MEEGCLHGIVNGIDTSWISPMDTRKVQMADVRVWKEHNATAIRHAFDLAPTRGPLFSIISRLVHQKGIDLAIEAAETIVDAGGQIAVTGRGDPKLESAIVDLARRYPGSVGVHIGFDELEARKMFSAADFLVMPSRFEPCGLSQMYAQRCGTLPIACRTGGLADTIEDNCSGFLFQSPCASDLIAALKRALLALALNPVSRPCANMHWGNASTGLTLPKNTWVSIANPCNVPRRLWPGRSPHRHRCCGSPAPRDWPPSSSRSPPIAAWACEVQPED
jgi:glycogen synthase